MCGLEITDFCAFSKPWFSYPQSHNGKEAVVQSLEGLATSEVEESKNVFGSASSSEMILYS